MTHTQPSLKAVLVAGPTASGKSGLALALAGHLRGCVVNADSMQVYRELRLLTARPSQDEEARQPHSLYGHVGAAEGYSAGRYAREAADAIAQARARGLRPIVVGGTGLYFRALTAGLSPIPPVDEAVRAHWRGEAERHGSAALHGVLRTRDPVMAARLRPSDPQRIVRALEVLDSTHRSLSEWQALPGTPVLDEDAIAARLVLMPQRDELNRRCDARFDAMMRQGALDEVAALAALDLSPDLPLMRALGVRPLMDHLAGRCALSEAVERAKAETRQYAKRQLTWLRGNMMSWEAVSAQETEIRIAELVRTVQSAD